MNPDDSGHWFVSISDDFVSVLDCGATAICINARMFPCFATEADARAAIAAVGEDRIVRCAKWLAGCA